MRILTILAALTLAAPARGQGRDTLPADSTRQPVTLEGIEVRALRGAEGAPVTASRVARAALQATYAGQEMPELLARNTPSVLTYSDAGIPSGYSYFRIRGMDQTRVNVTLDGVPLNEPEDQGVYFSNFPDFANSVASIQVQRGAGASSYGSAAYAGAVHFGTGGLATARRAAELQLGAGAYGSRRASAQGSTGLGPSRFAAYGRLSAQETDGYRAHSGNRSESGFVTGGYFGDRQVLRVSAFYGRARSQMAYLPTDEATLREDPRANPLTEEERDDFRQRFASVAYSRLLAPGLTASLTGYHNAVQGGYDVLIDGMWNFNVSSHWEGMIGSLGYERGGGRVDLGMHAYDYARDHWLHVRPDLAARVYSNQGRKREASAFVKASQVLGRLTLLADAELRSARFRYRPDEDAGIEALETDWTFLNPKLGASLRLRPGLDAYASLGRNHREPTRNDLFAGFDDLDSASIGFVGDLQRVRPERVTDLEAGVRWTGARAAVSANLFSMRFRDEIAPIGQLSYIGLPLRKNIPSSFRRGLELEGWLGLAPRLRASGHATWMNARIAEYTDDATGQTHRDVRPLMTPVFQSGHALEWDAAERLSLRLDGRYVDRAYLDNTQNRDFTTPPFYAVDAQATLRGSRGSLMIQLNNATDRRIYTGGQTDGVSAYYFVQARRHLVVTARLGGL